jgi:membrane protein
MIERTPKAVRRPVEVSFRTVNGAMADRILGLAAETSFYIILSLPALVVAIIAAIPVFVPTFDGQDWQSEFLARALEVSSVALTQSTIDSVVEPLLVSLLEDGSVGIVSFAFLAAIWVASRAAKVVLAATALVYGDVELRAGWLQRAIAVAVTVGALIIGTVLAPLLLAGPAFAEQAEGWFGVDLGPLVPIWRVGYWPTVVLLAMFAIAGLYRIAVPRGQSWWRDLPGAAAATGIWLLGSAGLRVYGAWLTGTESVYGPLAGPIVALLWLWLTALAVLLGAELNASLVRTGASEQDESQIAAGGIVADVTEVLPPPHRR